MVKMTATSFSEEMLLPALQNQDEKAIKYIYNSYWSMILQMVKTNNGSEEEAKDLYQEGMLDFLEKLWSGKLVLTCKIKTFIYSICRNKWLYHLRGKQKFVDIEDYIVMEKSITEETETDVALPNDDQLKKAIGLLGEPCQSLLIGFYYLGLSLEALSEKLNYKSANVVKQQKFRCKDRLKRLLQSI